MRNRKTIFSVPIDDICLVDIFSMIVNGDMDDSIIVTPNVDHVIRCNKDSDFSDIYKKADVFLNDSRILRLISKLGLCGISNVVPGSDLTEYIFKNFTRLKHKYAICVIGAEKNDIEVLKSKYDIGEVHHYNPPFGFISDPLEIQKCIEYCKNLPPCIYLISVGSPRQELLANRLRETNTSGVFLCVGASVLFLSGREKRAPRIIQILALEWSYRLIQSPRRMFRRYVVDGPYVFLLYIREMIKRLKA